MSDSISIPEEIDIETLWFVVDGITRQIGKRGEEILKQKAADAGLDLTEGLVNSLKTEVQTSTKWSEELILEFWEYGRFQDMKYTEGKGGKPGRNFVENMKVFAESILNGKVGRTPFTHLAGSLSIPIDKQKAINSFAWALAIGKLKKGINMRNNKGWYIRNYMKEIYGELEVNIQAAAAKAALNTVAKALREKE